MEPPQSELIEPPSQSPQHNHAPKKPHHHVVIACIVVILLLIGIGGFLFMRSRMMNGSDVRSVAPADPGWKTYQDATISISYPQNWIQYKDNGNVAFKSSDYIMSAKGHPENGVQVFLYTKSVPFSGKLGLISTEQITISDQPATLQLYQYEGDYLVITANDSGKSYQLVMSSSTEDAREENREDFLKIAQSIQLK